MSLYSNAKRTVLAPILGLAMLAGVGCGNPHNDFDGPIRNNDVEVDLALFGAWKKAQATYGDTGDSVSYSYLPWSRKVWRVVVENDNNRTSYIDWPFIGGPSQTIMDDAEATANGHLDDVVRVNTRNF
jgi:hypothetical protein